VFAASVKIATFADGGSITGFALRSYAKMVSDALHDVFWQSRRRLPFQQVSASSGVAGKR
jgi:hypothetical protein